MALTECKECKKQISERTVKCPHCWAKYKIKRPKKWYEKTWFTLSKVIAFLIFCFGFIHIITNVLTSHLLPFDIALKKSFGYRETFINAEKITSLPYVTAKIKYPIACEVLQRLEYIDSGGAFETGMKEILLDRMEQWQEEFEKNLNMPELSRQEQFLGQTETAGQDSSDAQDYNNRGITAAKQVQYEKAISEFARAFRRDPDFYEAYYNRAIVYISLGQLGPAAEDFTKVIEINPHFIKAYIERGKIYVTLSRYEQAIDDFSSALKIESDRADILFRRSFAYFTLGQYEKTWEDIYKIQQLGYKVPAGFLSSLNEVSDRIK